MDSDFATLNRLDRAIPAIKRWTRLDSPLTFLCVLGTLFTEVIVTGTMVADPMFVITKRSTVGHTGSCIRNTLATVRQGVQVSR